MSEVSSEAPVSEVAPENSVEESEVVETSEEEEQPKLEAKPEPPKSSKKVFTPKVNGKQHKVELDLSNEEEIMKYLSQALGAQEKFQEAAALRKNVDTLIHAMKTDLKGVLSHPDLGIDLKKFAEDILNQEIEELQKSPEQKELEKLRKELESRTAREKQLEEEKRTAEMSRLQEQAFKQFDDDLTEALSQSTLPKTPYVIKRAADLMIEATNLGYDVGVKDIMPILEKQVLSELQTMFEISPEETMEKIIGEKNLNRWRQKRLSQKSKPVQTASSIKSTGNTSSKKEETKEEAKKKFSDLFGSF